MLFWPIPAVCAVLAAIGAIVGATACMRAWHTLQDHADRLQAATPLALLDSGRLDAAISRIGRDFDGMAEQLSRLAGAVAEIRAGIAGLRFREAVVALRVAGLALRALRTLL